MPSSRKRALYWLGIAYVLAFFLGLALRTGRGGKVDPEGMAIFASVILFYFIDLKRHKRTVESNDALIAEQSPEIVIFLILLQAALLGYELVRMIVTLAG